MPLLTVWPKVAKIGFCVLIFAAAVLTEDAQKLDLDEVLMEDCTGAKCKEGYSLLQNSAAYVKRRKGRKAEEVAVQLDEQGKPIPLEGAGEVLVEATEEQLTESDLKKAKYERLLGVLRQDDTIFSDIRLMSGQTTVPNCAENPLKRGDRHKICSTSECGPPPLAYMVVDTGKNTILESFESPDEVGFDSNWDMSFTRTELNHEMTVEKQKCSCEGCDEWNEWAFHQLSRPTECKYPSHSWQLVFAEPDPKSSFIKEAVVTEGRTFLVKNHYMKELGLSPGVALKGFTTSTEYSNVASKVHDKFTWEQKRVASQKWQVTQGRGIAVWQYVLHCKLFNSAQMYINEALFWTRIKKATSGPKPTCDPRVDKCADDEPAGSYTVC